jgi:hypothetical protein
MSAGACHRAALRADPVAGMTTEGDEHAQSRDAFRPSFAQRPPSKRRGRRKCRVLAAPTVSAQGNCAKRALTNRFSRDIPAFPAQWFTAYFELSPVNQLVCHRHRRDA